LASLKCQQNLDDEEGLRDWDLCPERGAEGFDSNDGCSGVAKLAFEEYEGICTGLRQAMYPDWRGGAYGKVLVGGLLAVGDAVAWEVMDG